MSEHQDSYSYGPPLGHSHETVTHAVGTSQNTSQDCCMRQISLCRAWLHAVVLQAACVPRADQVAAAHWDRHGFLLYPPERGERMDIAQQRFQVSSAP